MPGPEKPGCMLKNLALSMADGVTHLKIKKSQSSAFPVFNIEIYTCNHSICVSSCWPIPEVPATRLKRFAHSAIVEAREAGTGVSPALQRAGRVTAENMQNCERDLHSLFWKCGLALPVRLSTMRFGLLYVHYISLSTWFRCLLGDYPHLLLGGFSDSSKASLLLESFWETYRVAHSDHFVFSQHPGNLKACVPYYLHLDEGTGLRKSAVLVFNFQAAFGQETAANFEKLFGEGTGRSDRDVKEYMVDAQTHNQRGSSFLSRFLFTVIPKKWYTKKFDFVYDRILAQLADEAARLACEGIRGMFPICLGLKGDAPALAKAAHYNRSFMSLALFSASLLNYIYTKVPFRGCHPESKPIPWIGFQTWSLHVCHFAIGHSEECFRKSWEGHLSRMLGRVG